MSTIIQVSFYGHVTVDSCLTCIYSCNITDMTPCLNWTSQAVIPNRFSGKITEGIEAGVITKKQGWKLHHH